MVIESHPESDSASHRGLAIVILGLLALVMLAACGLAPRLQSAAVATPTPVVIVVTATPVPYVPPVHSASEEQTVIDIYARASPGVVYITSRIIVRSRFWGAVPQEGTGSGFLIDQEGHIVTNYHVVENASQIIVTLSDETSVDATLIGVDYSNDLAVLKIDVSVDKLTPLELGTSATLRVGQRAIAIGNPFGLERTLTTGVISSLGRALEEEGNSTIYDVIQTDAAINSGNSGGPLLDSLGKVIGVNTAIYSTGGGSVGVGFAVPVDTVRRVVGSILKVGYYPHPTLGISGLSITPDLAELLELPVARGMLIVDVTQGQAGALAGLRGGQRRSQVGNYLIRVGGDILTAVDGTRVLEVDDLFQYLETKTQVGQVVTLTIMRDGKELTVQAELGEESR